MKTYDMRMATLAIADDLREAFFAFRRGELKVAGGDQYEPDIRAIIAANSDVPADRLDACADALKGNMGELRAMLALLAMAKNRVPTREDVEEFIPAAYWEDREGVEAVEGEVIA